MELRNSGKFRDEELSQRIVGAAIEVHKTLGAGFLESFYEQALCIELDLLGIPYERKKPSKFFIAIRRSANIALISL